MKFMNIEYNNTTNEVMFAETELGNYSPVMYQEELEDSGEGMVA